MIQINLVPDLKAESLKAQRAKRLVGSFALIVSGVFAGLVVLLFLHVNVNQRTHSKHLEEDIQNLSTEYKSVPDLDKVITVQKQLQALPRLHQTKPLVSRLAQYLSAITPNRVKITSVDVRFEDLDTISISGEGSDVPSVNVFASTIKNAQFTVADDPTVFTPFTNVVLDAINADDTNVSFDLIFNFDSQLFTNHDEIKLTVPKGDFTLSEQESPKIDTGRETNLFDAPSEGNQ